MPGNRKQRYLQHNKYNMSVFELLLQIIAPHHCLNCGLEGFLLCPACVRKLPDVPPRCYRCHLPSSQGRTCTACNKHSPLYAVTAATPYRHAAKDLIHNLKFERAQAAAADIAAALARRLDLAGVGCITYIPTAPARVRSRGYDQARLIARALSRRTGLPCYRLLGRTGNRRQVGAGAAERKLQAELAFYSRGAGRAAGLHVLLVDDVLTTGASCEAAAQVLLRAGARRVSAAVFALADAPKNKKPKL
jgi:ComF family protein